MWGLFGGALAVGIEWAFRVHIADSYLALLPWLLLPAVGVNYAVFRLVQLNGNIVAATVVFGMATLACRLGVTLLLGDRVGPGLWAAVGLMAMATLAKGMWR